MKEYKVMKAEKPEKAEKLMNEMAQEGWIVKDVSFWTNFEVTMWITFEREKEM